MKTVESLPKKDDIHLNTKKIKYKDLNKNKSYNVPIGINLGKYMDMNSKYGFRNK